MQAEDLKSRAVSSGHLSARLGINERYQRVDFQSWLFSKITVKSAQRVLDVGCGTGKQAIPMAKLTGGKGLVCAFDMSGESIAALKTKARENKLDNIRAATGDMNDTARVIRQYFPVRTFDVIHSSYALYYAADPLKTLEDLYAHLEDHGRMIVFCPRAPHGMIDFIKEFHSIPSAVEASLHFGENVLLPFFKSAFQEFRVCYYDNALDFPDAESFMTLYRATTYYDEKAAPAVQDAVQNTINTNGFISLEKNGFLIVGKGKKGRDL